jgi:hypothetical protein
MRDVVPADVAATDTSDVARGEPSRLLLPAVTRGAATCCNGRGQQSTTRCQESRAALPAVLSGAARTRLRCGRKPRVCNALIWTRLQRHFRWRIFDVYARSHCAGSAIAFSLSRDRSLATARSRSCVSAVPVAWSRDLNLVAAATRRSAVPMRSALSDALVICRAIARCSQRWSDVVSAHIRRACRGGAIR